MLNDGSAAYAQAELKSKDLLHTSRPVYLKDRPKAVKMYEYS